MCTLKKSVTEHSQKPSISNGTERPEAKSVVWVKILPSYCWCCTVLWIWTLTGGPSPLHPTTMKPSGKGRAIPWSLYEDQAKVLLQRIAGTNAVKRESGWTDNAVILSVRTLPEGTKRPLLVICAMRLATESILKNDNNESVFYFYVTSRGTTTSPRAYLFTFVSDASGKYYCRNRLETDRKRSLLDEITTLNLITFIITGNFQIKYTNK